MCVLGFGLIFIVFFIFIIFIGFVGGGVVVFGLFDLMVGDEFFVKWVVMEIILLEEVLVGGIVSLVVVVKVKDCIW